MRGAARRPSEAGAEGALGHGLVVGAHGRHVLVETDSGRRMHCHARGKRSDLVVGDRVRWAASGDGGVVEAIEPRRNLLHRQDAWRTKSFAANLDQLLILVAVEPPFGESQLARALIAAQAAGIPALIGLNKIDLPGRDAARARLAPYRAMGVEVLELALGPDAESARAVLLPRLAGRTTLLLGPSGMGKSTLINRLVPEAAAQVGEISAALNAGRHTTTTTTWYWLDAARSGALIDSPGFQEFGLHHVEPAQLAHLMPDLAATLGNCRFLDCTHRTEPGCGVRAAAAAGLIDPQRWRLYGELFEELSTRPRW
jgi:ribosome biogenesis GTPase